MSVETDEDLQTLIEVVRQSAVAYIRGDIDAYLELIHLSDDYTLMSPLGGPVVRGFDSSPQALQITREMFRSGEASVDIEQCYQSGDLAVLVAVERQHGEVGELPDQDWSLRITLVFRRTPSGWELVHRHADPLVHPIGIGHLAELSRGAPG
jgi:ketosteroid isomerase-like protein